MTMNAALKAGKGKIEEGMTISLNLLKAKTVTRSFGLKRNLPAIRKYHAQKEQLPFAVPSGIAHENDFFTHLRGIFGESKIFHAPRARPFDNPTFDWSILLALRTAG